MQMCLIASANPSMVFIDHLAVKKDEKGGIDPTLIHAQLTAFLSRVIKRVRSRKALYTELRFLAESESIVEFLDKVLGEDKSPEKVAELIYAVKSL